MLFKILIYNFFSSFLMIKNDASFRLVIITLTLNKLLFCLNLFYPARVKRRIREEIFIFI